MNEMDTETFAAKVRKAADEDDLGALDQLALRWLREGCAGKGREGKIGRLLLEIIETECLP